MKRFRWADPAARDCGAIRPARRKLAGGHVVCIFAEGAITRTGNLLPFNRGLERDPRRALDVPIIPVHSIGCGGSIFSFAGGRFFRKWPRRLPYPVTVSFGAPMPPGTEDLSRCTKAVAELAKRRGGVFRKTARDTLPLRFIHSAANELVEVRELPIPPYPRADRWPYAGGQSCWCRGGYGSTAWGVHDWGRGCRPRSPERSGETGMSLGGNMSVNPNFTSGVEAMCAAIGHCSIRTVITSKQFLRGGAISKPWTGRLLSRKSSRCEDRLEKLGALIAVLPGSGAIAYSANVARFASPAASSFRVGTPASRRASCSRIQPDREHRGDGAGLLAHRTM